MNSYQCDVCQHIYDPEVGDPQNGVVAGTPFESLAEDWRCPICGVGKSAFKPLSDDEEEGVC